MAATTHRPRAAATDIRRTITGNLKIFLSIFVICALGAGMLVALKAACDDLRHAADTYLDQQRLYDVSVQSTLGLTDADVDALAALDGVDAAVGAYTESAYTQVDGAPEKVDVKALCDEGLNEPQLVRGRLPRAVGEVAVTQKYLDATGKELGDAVSWGSGGAGEAGGVETDGTQGGEDAGSADTQVFARGSYTIVGAVRDPMDINSDKNTMSFRTSSTTKYAFFVTEDAVASPGTYTVAYLAVTGARELLCYSGKYEELVARVKDEAEQIREEREDARTSGVRSDALATIDEHENEAASRLAAAQDELDAGQAKLDANLAEALAGGRELDDREAEALAQLDAAQTTIDAGAAKLAGGRAQLDEGARELQAATEEFEAALPAAERALDAGKAQVDAGRAQAEAGLAQADGAVAQMLSALEASPVKIDNALAERWDAVKAAGASGDAAAREAAASAWEDELLRLGDQASTYRKLLDTMVGLLERQESAAQAKADKLAAARDTAAAKLADAETELAAADGALASAQEALDAAEDALARIDARIAELTATDPDSPELSGLREERERAAAARAQAAEGRDAAQAARDEAAGARDAAETALTAAEDALAAAQGKLQELSATLSTYRGYSQMLAQLDQLTQVDPATGRTGAHALAAGRYQAVDALAQVDAAQAQVDAGRAQLQAGRDRLAAARAALDANAAELAAGEAELAAGQAELSTRRAAALVQLAQARAQLQDGLAQIEAGTSELASGRATLEGERENAAAQIADARAEVDSLEGATWYIQDRGSLSSYASLGSDADSIEAIATVFPLIFFAVAVLISLTTITRMVEEDRGLIGLYKALGYRREQIMAKYLAYSLAASVAGTLAGDVLGFVVLPQVLFTVFDTMYALPAYELYFNPAYAAMGMGLFVAGIVGATYAACLRVLREVPATLMRPRAPRAGSRILLERVGFIWRRLGFLNKVAARNLFRYKKRFLMTVLGIAGCTGLMICGLGIRDTVSSFKGRQYGEDGVARYDLMAVSAGGDFDRATEMLEGANEVRDLLACRIDSVSAEFGGVKETVQLMVVPDGCDLSSYVRMADTDGRALELPSGSSAGGAVLTKNAEQVLGFSLDDTLTLQDSSLRQGTVRVAGVQLNYLGNFCYMTRSAYERAFGRETVPNAYLAHLSGSEEEQVAFADELAGQGVFLSITSTAQISNQFSESFKIIDTVVYVLTIMAACLAFAVVFTLSTTNISERERELATIKVLGFRRREVYRYINKETVILAIIGIAVGCPLGWGLTRFLSWVLRMPSLYFDTVVAPGTYVVAGALSLAFVLVINKITNRSLDRIVMVEALKSTE